MRVSSTPLAGVLIIEPEIHTDSRGFFMESWNQNKFNEAVGNNIRFVQDNHSRSTRGVLRGLHYQINHAQAKLVRVIRGCVLDVVVDIRKSSQTFGQYFSNLLSASNYQQMWIPAGFAHGFLVLSEDADFVYKTTDFYSAPDERCIRWDDPDLAIDWQMEKEGIFVSQKDNAGQSLSQAELFT